MSDVKLEDIVSLCKRRGFIYQGSEIYGGLAGTWDYGPLGVALKRNIMQLWWKMFVEDRDDMLGVDAAILMNKKVWEASGHTTTFTDPLVECSNCKSRFRYDHLVRDELSKLHEKEQKNKDKYEEVKKYKQAEPPHLIDYNKIKQEDPDLYKQLYEDQMGPDWIRLEEADSGAYTPEQVLSGVKCPACGQVSTIGNLRQFNMMFETNAGPIADESSKVYLRPETAQGIFTNYKNIIDSFYPDVPFGIAQQGKAFRNEISPRDFVFRSREFEQMEIEYFIHPEKWEEAFEMWVKQVHAWCEAIGLPKDSVHELEVPEADRAHYSKRTIDFEFDFPHKRDELLGLAYRTDFDLMNIQKASGKNMEYRPKAGGAPFVPHVIEPSFGVERAVMAVLVSAYSEDEVGGEKRAVLKLPAHLAPVKVAVSPLLKNKLELVKKARQVYDMLKQEFGAVNWDDNGNVGKRYRRSDEIGVPHHVTIDFDTLEDDTVTVRNRDTTEQVRVSTDMLIQKIKI
jgi:glycyl-tRNA synthetase